MSVRITPMTKKAGRLQAIGVVLGVDAEGSLYLEGPYGSFNQYGPFKEDGTVDSIN